MCRAATIPPKLQFNPLCVRPQAGAGPGSREGNRSSGVYRSGTPPEVTTAPPDRQPGDSSYLLPRLNPAPAAAPAAEPPRTAPTREGRRGPGAALRSQRLQQRRGTAADTTLFQTGPRGCRRDTSRPPGTAAMGGLEKREAEELKGPGLESGNGRNGSSPPAQARQPAPAPRAGSTAKGSDPRDPSPGRSPPERLRAQRRAPPRR